MGIDFWRLVFAGLLVYWAGYLGGKSDIGIVGEKVATLVAIGVKGKAILWLFIAGLIMLAGILGMNLII